MPLARVGTGYNAKILCSCVFVSGRTEASALAEDLAAYDYIDKKIDFEAKTVTASIQGLATQTAIYREGLGCSLVVGTSVEALKEETKEMNFAFSTQKNPVSLDLDSLAYPDSLFDKKQLEKALDIAFSEPDPNKSRNTRAVLVLYKGKIIAERYKTGITKDTPLLGWSMTKSVTHALTGILVRQGKLAINQTGLFEDWKQDERKNISLDHLLRMSSGLDFVEDYGSVSGATTMLFDSYQAGGYAKNSPLKVAPDQEWYYSSGTSNIISLLIRQQFESQENYWNFPRKELFNKIGMYSATLEPDPSGTFVGSSYMYATARDWARFGLLYAHDGIWNGARILPQDWVQYAITPTSNAPKGEYGAHFWLNAGHRDKPANKPFKQLPSDMYYCSGFEGQHVLVFPSQDLVVVRLGSSQPRDSWDMESFLVAVLKASRLPLEQL